jgi:hypothetical protein
MRQQRKERISEHRAEKWAPVFGKKDAASWIPAGKMIRPPVTVP